MKAAHSVPSQSITYRLPMPRCGGASHSAFGTIQPNSETHDNTAYGVLKFTLHSNSYDWEFVPIAGQTYTDSGTTACH